MNYDIHFRPVLTSAGVQEGKLQRVIVDDLPVVVCRSNGKVTVFEDFCPHRGAPLSEGYMAGNQIQCAYHGWKFDCGSGENKFVPVKNEPVHCALNKLYAVEKYGCIWVSRHADAFLPALREESPSLQKEGTIKAQPANTIENFLEGSHTHFVHKGVVRSDTNRRQKINALFQPNKNGFTVTYETEAAKGYITKLLPKKYRSLKPVATYIYPFTTILEYFNRENVSVLRIEAILSQSGDETKYFSRIYLNVGFLTPLAVLVSHFAFNKIIAQDKEILEKQEANLQRFQSKRFFSDETDIVGRQIYAWLHQADGKVKEDVTFNVYW